MEIIRIIGHWMELELRFWPLMLAIGLMIIIAEIRLANRGGQPYPMIYQFIDSRRPEAFDSRRWRAAYRIIDKIDRRGSLANFLRDAIAENSGGNSAEEEMIISEAIAQLAKGFDLRAAHDPAFMIEFDRRMRALIFAAIQDDRMNDGGLQDPWGLEADMIRLADLALQHGFLIADQDEALDMIDNALQDIAEEI